MRRNATTQRTRYSGAPVAPQLTPGKAWGQRRTEKAPPVRAKPFESSGGPAACSIDASCLGHYSHTHGQSGTMFCILDFIRPRTKQHPHSLDQLHNSSSCLDCDTGTASSVDWLCNHDFCISSVVGCRTNFPPRCAFHSIVTISGHAC